MIIWFLCSLGCTKYLHINESSFIQEMAKQIRDDLKNNVMQVVDDFEDLKFEPIYQITITL